MNWGARVGLLAGDECFRRGKSEQHGRTTRKCCAPVIGAATLSEMLLCSLFIILPLVTDPPRGTADHPVSMATRIVCPRDHSSPERSAFWDQGGFVWLGEERGDCISIIDRVV